MSATAREIILVALETQGLPELDAADRDGHCYPLALRYFLERGGVLAHGFPRHAPSNSRMGHAWIELDDGSVWDPTVDCFFDRELYYREGRISEEHVRRWATAEEVLDRLLETALIGNWAPTAGVGEEIVWRDAEPGG